MLIPLNHTIQKVKPTSEQFLAEVMSEIETKEKHRERGKIMHGKTDFEIPDTKALKKHLHERDYKIKLEIVD